MKPPRKILGFDNWTQGSHHFARLLPELSRLGFSLKLIHLGSWGNDPGRPSRERIGELEVCDISCYGSISFDEILEIEKPDAALLFSTQTFAHRAFLRYCRKRSIPTLHAYHGLANIEGTKTANGGYEIDRFAYARLVISKLSKLFRHTFPCYVAALWNTDADVTAWVRFFSDIWRMAQGKRCLVAAADARASKCAVYTEADIEHAVRFYGFVQGDVAVVGNPDLARFGLKQDMLGVRNTKASSEAAAVMYIDTGLVPSGLHFQDAKAFVEHLMETARLLAAQGRKLLLKPHPMNDLEFLKRDLAGTGIEMISNHEMLSRLGQCSACIVESSTLALVPALLGMPLLLANYGKLSGLRFGPVLTSYPRAHWLHNVAQVNNLLTDDREHLDAEAVRKWIALNSGPMPAEDVARRVASNIEAMIGDGVQRSPTKLSEGNR